jgi:glycogenin glucosyltransferase
LFVTRPSTELFLGLLELNKSVGSFDGGDQGLLNSFFSSWSGHAKTRAPKSVRLPFTYNVTPTAFYSYLPAFAEFNDCISCIHFIGKVKPWHYDRFADGGIVPR